MLGVATTAGTYSTSIRVMDSLGATFDRPTTLVISPIAMLDQSSLPKATVGSNCAHLTARFDERTGWILVIAALDNLTKGASGQAVQCANLALGLAETAGLPAVGLYP